MIKAILVWGLVFNPPAIQIQQPPEPKVTFTVVKSQYEIEQLKLAQDQERKKQEQREEQEWSNGLATGYCNCHDKLNGETGITAYGYNLDDGISYRGYSILASDRKFPFGTLVDIKTEEGKVIHGVVLDRGGAITGNHFDIVFASREGALAFGKRGIKFKIVGRLF